MLSTLTCVVHTQYELPGISPEPVPPEPVPPEPVPPEPASFIVESSGIMPKVYCVCTVCHASSGGVEPHETIPSSPVHVEKPGGSEAGDDGGCVAPSPHVNSNAEDGPVMMHKPDGCANAGSGFEQSLTPWW